MGTLQKNNTSEIWKQVLYVYSGKPIWLELAHGSSPIKGKYWSISKVRPEITSSTVLQMQYTSRREWRVVYNLHAKNRRGSIRGSDTKRSANNSKSNGSLPKVVRGLPVNGKRIYKIK